jgi:drug/metabolite transporter (DMT)-like permease
VMLLFYLAPVWSTLGGWLLLREHLGRQRLIALLLAMAGIVLTLGLSSDTFKPLGSADWLALSAGLGFSLNNLATRAADQVPLASKTLATYVGSAVLAVLCCLLLAQPLPPLNPALIALAALLGLGWLLALTAVQYGVSHIEAGRAAVLVVVELLVAVLSSAWLGEQAISPQEWLGAALITGAALLAGWPERSAVGTVVVRGH